MNLIGNINAIPFRRFRSGSGATPPFPSIPGMIARYSALGLTNEQMKENPVWVDKTGNGHDLQMKNLAWGGMSGVGGYNQNFNQWGYGNLSTATQTHTSYKIELSVPSTLKTANIYSNANSIGKEGDVYDFTLNIVGLKDGALLRITKGVVSGVIERIEKDGIYKIYQPIEAGWDQPRIYIFISNPNLVDLNITIEQLPLYPGALVFDGVDDWAGCDNLPLLPKEKGYSIIALRNWITRYDATQYKRPLISNLDTSDEGAFLIEYRKDENVNDVTGSYNSFTDVYIDDNNPITWQTSSSYNGQIIKKGTSKSANKLCICKTYFGQLSNYANAAIWEIVILDHDATEEELTKIKDYFVKTYPWLFPDQAWTVVGKTNEDEDRATIANITGNGNDLVLSNFGFAEGSGYNEEGEYAGYLVTDGVDDRIGSSSFTFNKDWTIVGNWTMLSNIPSNCGIVKVTSIFLYNSLDGVTIYFAGGPIKIQSKSINAFCSDGRLYLNDWTEILKPDVQTVLNRISSLNIASYSNKFTKMAFKNLAIYDGKILSKDDCIKAYNYLQTLKAK